MDSKGYDEWLARIINTAIIDIFPDAAMWHRDAVGRVKRDQVAAQPGAFDL